MAVAKALDSSPPEQIAAVAGGQADGEVSNVAENKILRGQWWWWIFAKICLHSIVFRP